MDGMIAIICLFMAMSVAGASWSLWESGHRMAAAIAAVIVVAILINYGVAIDS